jgi:hypothetical protein
MMEFEITTNYFIMYNYSDDKIVTTLIYGTDNPRDMKLYCEGLGEINDDRIHTKILYKNFEWEMIESGDEE